jgi:mono/diheme cytochrome c family protein
MRTIAASLLLLLAACSAPVAEQAAAPAAPAAAASTAHEHAHEHPHLPGPGETASAAVTGDATEGRRVALRVGCYGCHGQALAGAKLWAEEGLFQLWSANITEHIDHYGDADFERLLRTGKTHDGHRPLGMPVQMFQHLSDREVRDIAAAMRAAPKVANPGLQRSWMSPAGRRKLESYDDDRGDPVAVAAPSEPPGGGLALGRHLAMTSCTECHGTNLDGFEGEDAPPLVVAKGYSAEQFRKLMRTGITASGKESRTGLMSEVARERFAPSLTDAELDALKAFLDGR